MCAVMSAVGPEKITEAVRDLKGIMFPEEQYDKYKYIDKAKKMFEKLRKIDMRGKAI